MTTLAGRGLVRLAWAGTAGFTVVAAAGVAAPGRFGTMVAVVSMSLFAVGCGAFFVSYLRAIALSQTREVSVANIYGLSGIAPAPVRRWLLGAVAVQSAVALAAASVRPFTPVAFGILVPVYGLGVAGLWAVAHGQFAPREHRRRGPGG